MASIELIHCETLDDFCSRVSPIGELFGAVGSSFAFRGQSNSAWELVPRVFRKEVIAKYKVGMMSRLNDHPGQFFFEYVLLSGFINYCDETGLSIPNDSMEFRNYFNQNRITNVHGINNRSWPQENVIPLMALAQSHGIPTRLLDWSKNSYVACYFAAASAVDGDFNDDDKIALFAIDLNAISTVSGIRHVRVPGSTSQNLSSQGGSFMLVDNSGSRGEPFTSDVSVESKLSAGRSILTKVTLPKALAGDLLLRCNKFGFSAATVFPGYDGVAKAVLESTLAFNYLH